ncbi:MAG: hypothetical protein KJO98_17080, partial [Rhodothermia bacterium]|nr:hypothetical protein [Rhodothermia bacterium]
MMYSIQLSAFTRRPSWQATNGRTDIDGVSPANTRLGRPACPRSFAFVCMIFATGVLIGTANGQSPITSVSASDAVFEDRVEVTWTGSVAASSVVRIERDTEVMGVVASDVRIFQDTTADPRVSYEYCLIVTAADGTDSSPVCDNGTRAFFAPAGMAASDRLFEGHVLLTWTDRSQRETEYRIIRRLASETQFGGLVTLPANASSYRDTTALVGVEYRYGVAPHDADGFRSVFAFDNGERAAVTPPADVSASDGQYPNFVRLTWTDQSDQEDAFAIYRNGANIGTVSENATSFDDATATTAVTYSYCVASIVGGTESVQVCDDGMRGGLRSPSNVAATDDTFDDRVSITWNDDADTEDGFEVYRRLLSSPDSVLLATRPVNAT